MWACLSIVRQNPRGTFDFVGQYFKGEKIEPIINKDEQHFT
jgi:hypothetical protein